MPIATGTAALIAGGLGAAASLYGANKQSKDQSHADDLNRQAVGQSDLNSWRAYLMQRGVDPSGVNTFGSVPQNPVSVNARLPIGFNLTTPGAAGGPGAFTVRRRA